VCHRLDVCLLKGCVCHRFYDWAPYMSEDMQWFVRGLCALVREVVVTLQHSDTDTPAAASSIMER